ncbi:MAG: hypothetical protein AAF740_03450 [Bacteroidota bacterium]
MFERLRKFSRLFYVHYDCIKALPEAQSSLLLASRNSTNSTNSLQTLSSKVHCINLLVAKLIVVKASPAV